MSEKNSKIIRDFCEFSREFNKKQFDPNRIQKRYTSLNRKARIVGLKIMLADLIRWEIPKYVQINNKRSKPLYTNIS